MFLLDTNILCYTSFMNFKLLKKVFLFSSLSMLLFSGICLPSNIKKNAINDKIQGEETNFTNLIAFAKFQGEDEFINDIYSDVSVRQIVENMYTSSEYSISNYFNLSSNGKVKIKNVYAFDNGNSITLEKQRGYYAEYSEENPIGYTYSEQYERLYDLKEDWGKSLNSLFSSQDKLFDYQGNSLYNYDILDKNSDGKIDAITIIYKPSPDNISVSWSSPLWNYQDYSSLVEFNYNGKTITSGNYVQLTNTYTHLYKDRSGFKIISLGATTHEMAHIFGLKDLYNSQFQSPIYYMSLMGKPISPLPQYLTCKEREALGWIDDNMIKTINKNDIYSLSAVKSSKQNEVIAYKAKLKNNKTLYLEYRNFDSKENIFDTQRKDCYQEDGTQILGLSLKSGLVCYLADSDIKFPSNLNVSGNKWTFQALGGTYATKSDCAVKEGEEIFADSDTSISVISLDENELTFEIKGAFEEEIVEITGVKITDFRSLLKREEEYQLKVEILGNNIENEKVKWSVFNNTSSNTKVSETGYLTIAKDENSKNIFVTAETTNGYKDTISIELNIIHDLIHFEFLDSTCTEKGNIEYWYCAECNKYFRDSNHNFEISFDETILDFKSHEEMVIPGYDSTCEKEGLTEGIICKNCSKVILEQKIIPKKDHVYSEWIIDEYPTYISNGKRHKECVNCHKVLISEEIPKINNSTSSSSSLVSYSSVSSAFISSSKNSTISSSYSSSSSKVSSSISSSMLSNSTSSNSSITSNGGNVNINVISIIVASLSLVAIIVIFVTVFII